MTDIKTETIELTTWQIAALDVAIEQLAERSKLEYDMGLTSRRGYNDLAKLAELISRTGYIKVIAKVD